MPVKKKDLYVAKSLKALNDLAALPAKMTTNPKMYVLSSVYFLLYAVPF